MTKEPLTEEQKEALRKVLPTRERRDLVCPDCLHALVLKVGTYGRFYGCSAYPECKTGISADDTGEPLGIVADRQVRRSRHRLILAYKVLWEKLPVAEYANCRPFGTRIGEMNCEECEDLLRQIIVKQPWLEEELEKLPPLDRLTRHQRLMDDNDPLERALYAE